MNHKNAYSFLSFVLFLSLSLLVFLLSGCGPATEENSPSTFSPSFARTGAETSSSNVNSETERPTKLESTPLPQDTQAGTTQIAGRNAITLEYKIDRSDVPSLTYKSLTLLIDVGAVDSVTASVDGTEIPFRYKPETGTIALTTAADHFSLVLSNPQTTDGLGSFIKAPLKDNKGWAWSHGLDDNTNLNPSIEAFQKKGWRATLFLIAKDVDATRTEGWIVDAPRLRQLLPDGWSIGNHTWDHACNEPDINRETVLQGYNRLQQVVETSTVPDYRILSFATPCFAEGYAPLLEELRAQGEISSLYTESGPDYRLVVDPGTSTSYEADGQSAVPFTFTSTIGRDGSVGWDFAAARETIDWLANHTSEDRHFWYNSLSHGGDEDILTRVLDYVYDNYGPGGTDEVWVAPSDEIYSYLLVRDKSEVSFSRQP